jgi:predicted PurR-regulated permease PerM
MTRKTQGIVFLSVLLALLAPLAILLIWPFLEPLVFALVLTVAFYPVQRQLVIQMRSRGRAAAVSLLLIMLLVGLPVTFILVKASSEAVHAAAVVSRKSAEQGGLEAFAMNVMQRPLDWIGRYVDLSNYDVQSQIQSKMNVLSAFLFRSGASVLGNLLGLLGSALICLFTVFFMLRDGDRVIERLVELIPLPREHSTRLMRGINDTIIANVYAMVAVGVAQGGLTTIAMLILSVPSAVLFGLAAAFASVIPLVGTALVWIPVAGFLFFSGHPGKALFLVIWSLLLVGTIDNVIRPFVVVGKVGAHPLLLVFSMLGGVAAFGFIGLFIGPVVLSVLTAVTASLMEMIKHPGDDTSLAVP